MATLNQTLVQIASGKDSRLTAKQVAYMELAGAKKDSDCRKVNVSGGISSKLGCCNEFQPKNSDVSAFRCGTCEYIKRGT